MPRKSTAAELLAEEAAQNSPLRRSNRIGSVTIPVAITKGSSQSSNSQENIPARATRRRRASAQDAVETPEVKPITKTRRASLLAEEGIQKETPSTPTRRTRKPSITTEPTEKEESEKPKPVRGRRNSSNTTEEPDEKKKLASVRSRRNSANIEPEAEVKVTTKTPLRTTRRRSSATENAVVEEVPTPAKRTTRGRKASDTEEISDIKEEVKKPTTRGRKKSVTLEEGERNEDAVKPAGRKGRKLSTDDPSESTAQKTPGMFEKHQSTTQKADSEDASTNDSSEVQKPKNIIEDSKSDEEVSAKILSEVAVKVTPLKKRKVLENMEEFGLSTINESSGDISHSKHDESSEISESDENKKEDHEEEMLPMNLKEALINITPLKKRKILDKMEEMDLSVINESLDTSDNGEHNKTSEITERVESEQDNKQIKSDPKKSNQSAEDLVEEPLNTSSHESSFKREGSPNRSLKSADDPSELNNKSPNTPSKKRLSSGNNENTSPRKSPRLSEKLLNNSSKKQGDPGKAPTSRNTTNLIKEIEKEQSVNEQTLASFVSSGSDGSFKFHLSNVSITNSGQYDSNKETTQDDLLNTSNGSNKENIEQVDSLNVSKAVLNITTEIPTQKPIVVSRVSNVFKPNQKDCSFMEPMEIDEDSVIYLETSQAETNRKIDNRLNDDNMAEKVSSSVEVSTDGLAEMSSDLDERSVIFNYRASAKRTEGKSNYKPTLASPNQRKETLDPTNISLKQSLTETEGSDTNMIIEETQDMVNFSIKPKTEKTDDPKSIAEKHSCPSPARVDASLIINQPLEQLKVVLSRKSSSPIITRRKSRSPLPKTGDIPDSGSDPYGSLEPEALTVPRKSKSKSPSPRRSSLRSPSFLSIDRDKRVKSRRSTSPVCHDNKMLQIQSDRSTSKSPSPRRSSVRSPSFLSIDCDEKVKSKKSTSPVAHDNKILQIESDRSRSKSPRARRSAAKSPNCLRVVDVAVKSRKSNSPLPSEVEKKLRPISHGDSPKRLSESKTKRLTEFEENPVLQDNEQFTHKKTISSMSKSPLTESAFLDQSYEKPKGTEEILVINIKKSKEVDDILAKEAKTDDKDVSLKHLPDSVATSDVNVTDFEGTNIQDKTEYHTAVATTNNGSAFTSLVTTDNEVSESNIKHCESHYDFDLDSDADDLMDSKVNNSDIGIQTSVYDKKTLAADEELEIGRRAVAERKKSFRKSKTPDELSEQSVKADDPDGQLSKSDLGESDSVSINKLPESSKLCTEQVDIEDEDFRDISTDLPKDVRSSEKKRKSAPGRDTNENMQLKSSSNTKDVTREKYTVVNDETEQEIKKSKQRDCLESSRNSNDMDDSNQKDSQAHKSLEQVTTCNMAVQKTDKVQSRNSSYTEKEAKIKGLKSSKRKPSLEEFASLKLEEYLGSKAEEIEESSDEEKEDSRSEVGEESEAEYNQFIDGMAEEGEEDTPSEDSNQIIDEGESIGYSSNEEKSDDSYDENDSFICDDEEPQLLSGDEYDLGPEKKKTKTKKSRIIDPNTLGDNDIIKIPEKKMEPKKRSRIITVSDSSDDDQEQNDSVFKPPEPIIHKESAENAQQGQTDNESVILIEDSTTYDESNNIIEDSKTTRSEEPIVIEETKNKIASESPHNTMKDLKIVHSVKEASVEDSKTMDSSKETPADQSYAKNSNNSIVTEESNTESIHNSMLLSNLNASLQKRNRKSSLSIQENILVDGVQDPLISKRINALVDSFCSTVTQGEIALNLSLEFEDTSQGNAKKQVINVLSDIKIYPSQPSQSIVSQEANQEVVDVQEDTEPEEAKLGSSLVEPEDLKEINRKNLKRRLSKSVDDIREEVTAAKRRKTHKKDDKKAASRGKITQPYTSKAKKRNKKYAVEQLSSAISSFSIMNQLVTDVKNRPKRMIKPTKTDVEVENTWTTTKITNLKPSTSPMTKQEKISIPSKLHPKDFRNQMLSDEKRVKRVDTKTLLKKKGAFY